ncbi:MAG: sensor histidine kinase [Nitrospira sp.]|nr:MAG: sensor histidine kinase [Nitrospira sp.]
MTAPISPASTTCRMTLWTKLVVFTTLIVVATCSALGWFFIQQQAASVTDGLIDSGTLLAKHLAISSRYSVLVNDHIQVREQIAGLLAVEHVAYAMIRSADGRLLGAVGKGAWKQPFTDERVADLFSLPAAPPAASRSSITPTVRRILLEDGIPRIVELPTSQFNHVLSLVLRRLAPQPSYFDVAVPVLSASAAFDDDPALSLTLHETPDPAAEDRPKSSAVYGTVHVGLSDAHTLDLLRTLIRQVLLLTAVTIAIGLVGVLFLARRISTPVKSLTAAAAHLAGGDFSARATPCSSDEIGDLTRVFNNMVCSLQSHEQKMQELNHTLEARVQARTDELQRANRRLQELSNVKTALVSNASHELRTPVTSMKVHLSNLLNGVGGPITPGQADALRRVSENTERLRQMIDDLLDLSCLQAGRMTLKMAAVRLNEVIQDVLLTLHHYYSVQKNLSVRVDLPDSMCCVWGDEEKLRQVFTNLIHNAVKFTPSGGMIQLTGRNTGGEIVTVCVADSGCGIPPGELGKIFLPFYRSSNGMDTRGSGLGLSIVKELVELHSGAVRVESTVAKGSRFFVDLPVTARSSSDIPPDT